MPPSCAWPATRSGRRHAEGTSLDGLTFKHAKVQRLRRLISRGSARASEGVLVAEGATVLGEALRAGVRVESVFLDPSRADPAAQAVAADALGHGARVFDLAPGVLQRVAGTVTPQPVLGIVGDVRVPLAALRAATLLIVCVDVRDPGNAGTVLRSAEAAGAGGVVCCDGSVDITNPKCVRASAGSLFHVPVVAGGDAVTVLEEIAAWGVRRMATVVGDGVDYAAANLTAPLAFVLGNEAHGLPPEVVATVDDRVRIPMAGRTQSLNVGMACAVLCFEAARQRREAAATSRSGRP